MLPFIGDRNGVCVLSGLSRTYESDFLNGHEEEAGGPNLFGFQDAGTTASAMPMLNAGSETMGNFFLKAVEPASGTRIGYQVVRLLGRFPQGVDKNMVYVSFGNKLQQPISVSSDMIQCYSVPVRNVVRNVSIKVSFNGGSSFLPGTVRFRYTDSEFSQMFFPGSHVYHWGTASLYGLVDEKGHIQTRDDLVPALGGASTSGHHHKRPAWVEAKYPPLLPREALLLGTVARQELNANDLDVVNEYLLPNDLDGIRALEDMIHHAQDRNIEPYTSLAGLKTQMLGVMKNGMAIRQIACSENLVLVLLDNGMMVAQAPVDMESNFHEWMTPENMTNALEVLANDLAEANQASVNAGRSTGGDGPFGSTGSNMGGGKGNDVKRKRISTAKGRNTALRIGNTIRRKTGLGTTISQGGHRMNVVMIPPDMPHIDSMITSYEQNQQLVSRLNQHQQRQQYPQGGDVPQEDDLEENQPNIEGQGAWFFGSKTDSVNAHGEPRFPKVYKFPSFQQVTMVAAGNNHFCAVTDAMQGGKLFSWGDNSNGQVGIDDDIFYVKRPVPVEIRQDGMLVEYTVCSIACGPKTTMAAVQTRSGNTSIYSWGDDDPVSSGGVCRGAFPHLEKAWAPVHSISVRPIAFGGYGKPFWNDSLRQWLSTVEQDWFASGSNAPYHAQVSEAAKKLNHLGKYVAAMDKHIQMKHAYTEELEQALDVDKGTKNNTTDIAQAEVESVIQSLTTSIDFLRGNLEEVAHVHAKLILERRLAKLATKQAYDEIQDLKDMLAAEESDVDSQNDDFMENRNQSSSDATETAATTITSEDGRPSLLRSGGRQSPNSSLRRISQLEGGRSQRARLGSSDSQEGPSSVSSLEDEGSGSQKEGRRKRFSTAFHGLMRRMRKGSRGAKGGDLASSTINELDQETDEEEDPGQSINMQLGSLQTQISQLENYIDTLSDQIATNDDIADDLQYQIHQLMGQKSLFTSFRHDGEHQIGPGEGGAQDGLGDDFQVLLELLEDVSSYSVTKMALQSSLSEATSVQDLDRLFSRPNAMVKESTPTEKGTPTQSVHGLVGIADSLQAKIHNTQQSVAILQNADDPITSKLVDMAQDICALKQIHLHGLKSLSSETERLLSMKLATEFAVADFSHVPSLTQHVKKINSPFQ